MLKEDWTKKEKEKAVLENGAKLLEERIVTAFGRDNPIKIFSASQILQAVQIYQQRNPGQTNPLYQSTMRKMWKGILDDRTVLIKKNNGAEDFLRERVFRDIVVSSMMSSHRNVLKLLGCCLEFPVPALVYEYAEKGRLKETGGLDEDGSVLSWKNRLKIAKEIASAVAYMHTAFPTRIIHRDINPRSILVTEDYTAKLTDFAYSISIPEGEQHVEDTIQGWLGFIDPFYIDTGLITEKADVFSFGILLLNLSTGKPGILRKDNGTASPVFSWYDEEGKFNEVVDPAILGNVAGEEAEPHPQLQAFFELYQSCVKLNPVERPSMTDVAKELLRIEKSIPAPQF